LANPPLVSPTPTTPSVPFKINLRDYTTVRKTSWKYSIKNRVIFEPSKKGFRSTMSDSVPRKADFLVPALPLILEKSSDSDSNSKDSFVEYKLKERPGVRNSTQTYKLFVKRFGDGTPAEWLKTLWALCEIWRQNSINAPLDRVANVKAVLEEEALSQFEASIEEQVEEQQDDDEDELRHGRS